MKNRNWFWGIIFLLAAVLVIASQITSFNQIGVGSIIVTVMLGTLIIKSLVELNFIGVFIPVAVLYMIYQQPLRLVYMSPWTLILAAVLASIGLSYFFHGRHHKTKYSHCDNKCFSNDSENMDSNNPSASLSFGSSSKYLHSDCLKSGRFSASFGSMEIYFGEAQLSPEGAEICLDCSFGTIELYVPRNWRIIDKLHISIGNVDNSIRADQPQDNAPQLTIIGNVQWGNVEIHYI